MLMSRPRKLGMMKMLCPAGKLVPKAPDGMAKDKWAKFYNWPRDSMGSPLPDSPGFPKPEDIREMTIEVPNDEHHAVVLIAKGSCSLVAENAPIPAPVPVKPKKDKG